MSWRNAIRQKRDRRALERQLEYQRNARRERVSERRGMPAID
jgi:hypothetical protein